MPLTQRNFRFLLCLLIQVVLSATEDSSRVHGEKCGLYLAESTIPGAGMGVFAGHQPIAVGDNVGGKDLVIPLFDIVWHNSWREVFKFLWDEYSWDSSEFRNVRMDLEVGSDGSVDAISPGMGAAANSYASLANVDDRYTNVKHPFLHNTTSPGRGAITPYYARNFEAITDISPGREIFVDYGRSYFKQRPDTYGYIPLGRAFTRADQILRKYQHLRQSIRSRNLHLQDDPRCPVMRGIWEQVLNARNIWKKSRTLNALPTNEALIDALMSSGGTAKMDFNRSSRELDWLEENGTCLDNIRPGESTISNAGRGAFASRFLAKGEVVAPAPLIHIPDSTVLAMYNIAMDGRPEYYESGEGMEPSTYQLLLNYCFGHEESTLLLCPYGMLTSHINHSSKYPNTAIKWSESMRNPKWRNWTIPAWGDDLHAGLSFDYVALRDIEEGEEITVNYGAMWEEAWQQHEASFEPNRWHLPSEILNEMDSRTFSTFERANPHSEDGVTMWCRDHFFSEELKRKLLLRKHKKLTSRILKRELERPGSLDSECGVIQQLENGKYVAELYRLGTRNSTCRIEDERILYGVPADAFYFKDLPYSFDHHQPRAFRYWMGIPDEIFPDVWRNRRDSRSS